MATFLEICQNTALESGTVPGSGQPTAVTGQTGRLLRIVNWVARAYRDIQNADRHWRWLEAEFSNALTQNVAEYSPTDLGLTRFSHWLTERPDDISMFTIYETTTGRSDEGPMSFVRWPDYQPVYKVGANVSTTGRPTIFSVGPGNKIHLFATPDATGFTMRGRYYKSDQLLAADSDTPEMPERFHDAIMFQALAYMAIFDEDNNKAAMWRGEYYRVLSDLRADQMPPLEMGEPLV